jgi:outer membrane protein
MKRWVCIVFFFGMTLSFQCVQAQLPGPVTLSEAFKAALQRTETGKIENARVQQVEERYRQAKGGILPKVALNWSYLRQDVPPSTSDQSRVLASSLAQDQVNSRLTLTQPVFQGFREFAALGIGRANLEAAERNRDNAILTLFQTVATAHYNVLANEKDLSNINDLIKVAEDRIRELKNFTGIGRSRRSDLLSSQAQLASLRAQAAAAETARIQAREQFAFVTGLSSDTELVDDSNQLPMNPPSLDSLLSQVESRADIKTLMAQKTSAEESVKYAKGGYWPNLSLTGNYYINRTGFLQDSKWDVGLNLTFPLYEGGTTSSQVSEANAALMESSLLLDQGRRLATQQIRSAYKAILNGVDQIRLLKESLTLAQQAYDLQARDFRRGASTNLEVLEALNSLEDTRRTLDKTYFQTRLTFITLDVALGKAPSH